MTNRVNTSLATTLREIAASSRGDDAHPAIEHLVDVLGQASARLAVAAVQLADREVGRPFRLVLMGRTMAGKSTLFEYLTGGDGTRVGVGGQRTTRQVSTRSVDELGIEVVDTPGVGAMDGAEDFAAAFSEVADADLILWVATDEATQEQTGLALEFLSDLGKPIVVVLNCLRDVTDELGLWDMVHEPEQVFGGDALGNLAPIERHLSKAGGRYLDAIPVHAQAAMTARAGALSAETAQTLHVHSRIDELIDAIRLQRDRTAELRRIVSIGDFARVELLETASVLDRLLLDSRSTLVASKTGREQFRRRATRRLDDAHQEIRTLFADALLARERWVEHIDVDLSDRKINELWSRETDVLRDEMEQRGGDIARRVDAGLKEIALDIEDDWSLADIGGFRDLGGRGSIWGNRIVKIGGRLGVATGVAAGTGWLGAKIGAVIGTGVMPGVGTAIGVVVGAALGLLLAFLGVDRGIDWIGDKLFRSPSEIHERRREKVRLQMPALLEELEGHLETASDDVRNGWQGVLDDELERQDRCNVSLERVHAILVHLSTETIESALAQVDTDLARALLRSQGRDRAASMVTRATRWRGAGLAVELPEPAFSELILYPLPELVERIVPTALHATRTGSAVQIVRNLSTRQIEVAQWSDNSLALSIGEALSPGVKEAWVALVRIHTTVKATIEDHIEGDTA